MTGNMLAMSALVRTHAASSWKAVHVQELFDEALSFGGFARSGNRREKMPETITITSLTNALGRYGLSMDVSDAVLEAIRDEFDDEDASTVRALIMLACLTGGGFDVKLDLVFRALDASNVRGITSEQCEALGIDCVRVMAAVLESDEESPVDDLEFALGVWNTCVHDAVTAAGNDASLGMFTLEQFKGLAKSWLVQLGKKSLEIAEGEDQPQERQHRRRRTSSGAASMPNVRLSGSGLSLDPTTLIKNAAGAFVGSDAARNRKSSDGNGIIGRVFESVTRNAGNHSPLRGSAMRHAHEGDALEHRMSTDSADFEDPENGVLHQNTPIPHHRSKQSHSAMDWLSSIPGSIVEMMGMQQTRATPDWSTKPPDITEEEWEHAKLAAEVDYAREETNFAENQQVAEVSNWKNLMKFVKEIAGRLFLFNTVRLLLTIALLGGDAALCLYVVGYFGVVGGLGFVVVINLMFAGIFIFFMLKYNKRASGKANMQFGANLVQGIQDVARSKQALDGLAGFAGGSERDPTSPRGQEPTPRAFGRSNAFGRNESIYPVQNTFQRSETFQRPADAVLQRQETRRDIDRRIQRTMSGALLADMR